MRRRHSRWRSFAHGLMLAGLPAAAFLAADYLLAPPASTSRPDAEVQTAAGGDRRAEPAGTRPMSRTVAPASQQAATPSAATRTSARPAGSGDPHSSLIASIQRELRRVGCYGGDVDGTWNDPTRTAMSAFNDSVNVALTAKGPDFILLTLLQGHSGKACTRSEPAIEAQAAPAARPVVPAPSRSVALPGQATVASGKIQSPIASTWSVTTSQSAVPQPRADAEADRVAPTPTTNGAKAPALPGRMAVGALGPTPDAVEQRSLAEEPAVAPRSSAKLLLPHSRPVPVPVARSGGNDAPARKAALGRTFLELSRNSP